MKNKLFIYALLLICAISFDCRQKTDELTDTHNNKRLRDVVVSYMSEPLFRCKDFVQQATGTEADLKLYDLDEKTLYFSINKKDYDSSTTLSKLTIDRNAVEFGFEQNGDVFLGSYTLKGTGRMLFRFPKNDFKPDSTRNITVKLSDGFEYTQSLNELADFADDISVYGGKSDPEIKKNKYLANHGAFVSVPGEKSLTRLVKMIVKEGSSKEETAQRLLDFVTSQISFSQKEAYGGYEVLKRPNEVLMTGVSDCSGTAVLYASLLEQAGIDYLLVYSPGHISVGVSGKYNNSNGLTFTFEGNKYSIAETTVNGFIIGNTVLQQKDITGEISFLQRPGKDSKFINYKTGKVISN